MGNCSLCSEPPQSNFERPERNQFKEIKDQKIQSDCFAFISDPNQDISDISTKPDSFLVQDNYLWIDKPLTLPLKISFDFIFKNTGTLMPVWSDKREE